MSLNLFFSSKKVVNFPLTKPVAIKKLSGIHSRVGINVSYESLLLVDKNVKNKNPDILLVDTVEKNKEGGV